MGLNVVEILVRAKDESKAGFAEADGTATGFSRVLKASMFVGAAAVAAVGYEATKMAIDFQSAMTKLTTQAGVPKAALKGLSAGVLQLAGQVGFSPDSLAESLYHVASNMESVGGTTAQMMNVVRVAAEGAKVGGADLVDVTNALTSVIASGIPGVKNYSQAMGVLNAIVGTGDMTMQNLAESMATGVVPVVKGYGLTLQDVGAALATYGDLNIRGAHAGTQLRLAVQALAVPAKTGVGALNAIGISATRLAGDMEKGGLKLAINDLITHMHKAGITGKTMGALITEAFGKKAGAGLALLAENADRFNSKYPALIKGAHDFGAAWATTQGTLQQKLADLRGKFDAVMTSIGGKLIPVLTQLASFVLSSLIPAIGSLVNWMSKHRDQVIAVAAGIMAMLVPAFIAWAAAAIPAAAATVIAAAPLIGLGIAVTAVVLAILELAHHWRGAWTDIKHWAVDAWHFIDNDVIHPLMHGISDLVSWIGAHWRMLATILATVLLGPVGFLIAFIATHWNQFRQLTSRLITDVTGFFARLPGNILHALSNLGSMLFNLGKSAIAGLWNGLKSAVGGVLSWAGGIGHDIANAIGGAFGMHFSEPSEATQMVKAGRKIPQGLATGMLAGLPSLRAAAAGLGRAGLPGGGYGGGGVQLVISPGSANFLALVKAIWPDLKLEVRTVGGGGTNSVQRALGQTH